MSTSVEELEQYIDNRYMAAMSQSVSQVSPKPVTMSTSTPEQYSTPGKQPSTGIDEDGIDEGGRGRKRKNISPVINTSVMSLSEEKLSVSEEKIRDAVMETMVSWMGEMQYTMQQSFNRQFEQSVEKMKTEILHEVNVSGSSDILHSVSFTSDSVDDLQKSVLDLKKQNAELKHKCCILEGRLTRAEKEMMEVKEESLKQEARSMRDNLVFFNVPGETENEVCEDTLRYFLATEMKINEDNMQKIQFDRVHRTGKNERDRHRAIVAKFNPYEGRQIVLSHIKYLDRNKKFGVNEQLPKQMLERKKQLKPVYKNAKKDKKNVKWSMDKLMIEGKVKEAQKDTIKNVNLDITEKAMNLRVRSSPLQQIQDDSFRGHSVNIATQDDIIPALHAVYADSRVARASHNVYAYRIKTPSGRLIEHYEDDGEWGAGAKVLMMLQDNQVVNKLVCVTRWDGGTYLGSVRFRQIVDAAQMALNIDDSLH